MLKPTRILVPTDFSEYSDKALKQGLDIAQQYQSKVYILHVIPTIAGYAVDYSISDDFATTAEEQARHTSSENLQKQLAKYTHTVETEMHIVAGVPYEAILSFAEEKQIDLIVIASLGRSGVARYLVGSVARKILQGSRCPVLLTK